MLKYIKVKQFFYLKFYLLIKINNNHNYQTIKELNKKFRNIQVQVAYNY